MGRPARRAKIETPRQALDRLYAETVDCGDMARGWFDGPGLAWREGLDPAARAAVATEGLAITSRLMVVMSWLLHAAHAGREPRVQRFAGSPEEPLPANHPLGGTPGGAIAAKSRELLARATTIASLFQEP